MIHILVGSAAVNNYCVLAPKNKPSNAGNDMAQKARVGAVNSGCRSRTGPEGRVMASLAPADPRAHQVIVYQRIAIVLRTEYLSVKIVRDQMIFRRLTDAPEDPWAIFFFSVCVWGPNVVMRRRGNQHESPALSPGIDEPYSGFRQPRTDDWKQARPTTGQHSHLPMARRQDLVSFGG